MTFGTFTSPSQTLKILRSGVFAFILIPAMSYSFTSTSGQPTYNTAVPSRFRPTTVQFDMLQFNLNGGVGLENGWVNIDSDGIIKFGKYSTTPNSIPSASSWA